ncbi:4-hydroxybutyrate dehydrogenase [Sporomusaceae bacterium BoRhaA]|uniref:4-hydroxybutyrate dehydrogenase n=1 Tax=Pelorhabdus rhamnosifermentans TaxID=2772457 RepID=UPI001C060EAD|nr:4-hydroxybutyrate dehydrogenase [Pelorhabdus rhamnosifermentans]MBU2703949.1 4-hydroxybutyrate dehydrogenase [Pelorhabdus rhamnosifermentans]
MKEFSLVPNIVLFDTCREFVKNCKIGAGDLIITSTHTYVAHFESLIKDAAVIYIRTYGQGEPSDDMVEAMYTDVKNIDYKRVVAIGGGTVIDVAKLFALKTVSPVLDLYDHIIPGVKDKELLILPTTCGTGSEVTNISILALKSRHTKMGLAVPALFADKAVLIPELLHDLPFEFFATSSIDALVHAMESYLSPKASPFTEIFSIQAIEMIISGYQKIATNGEAARIPLLNDFLIASTYAGVAFGNAGCGAVHAMSYPLGAIYHVPHGESNYAMLIGVFKTYMRLNPTGKIKRLNNILVKLLGCAEDKVYDEMEKLLNRILQKKSLHEYGVVREDLILFTESVMEKQGRLMANNYAELSKEMVLGIYNQLY